MSEKRIVKRMATCNSCKHFKEARYGDWAGYTPVCTQLPTQIGINEYKEGSEKTALWVFNCTEALFCPNYEKAGDDYVSRVRNGMMICCPGSYDEPHNRIYTDRQFYRTEQGKKFLENLGVKRKITKSQKLTDESFAKLQQRNVELERKLEQTEKDLADYQFNYPTIKELQKENAVLKARIEKQDADIFSLKHLTERLRLQLDILKEQMPWNDIKDKSAVIEKLTDAKENN